MEPPVHIAPEAALRPGAPPRPPHPLLDIADKADRGVAAICRFVLLATGIVLMGVLTANVVARYILSTGGFDWGEEVPEQVFPWFIMAGVALAVQSGGHVAVEWLLDKLGREANRLVLIAGHVLVACAYALLVWQALEVAAIVAVERSPALGLPKTYGYGSIAAGCALLTVSTLAATVRLALVGPEAMPRPAPEEMPA